MYLIFMGVSGSGKSTYARMIADAYDWPFFEDDDYHPSENVEKMSRHFATLTPRNVKGIQR